MAEFIIKAPEEMALAAKEIVSLAALKSIFFLYGPLGSGKTTLVKALGRLMEVEDSISSPTFSLVNEYRHPKGLIYHIDLYRLDSLDEAINIGIEEYLYQPDICLIEWPEIIESIAPAHCKIHIENIDKSTRKVIFS
jgi:tRNA threonylcarbamoyladenosine biosynthesis protein TsaE